MSLPIIGIGASAGGIESFSELLACLPAGTGMAYVFVQHLDPGHASRLVEILSKRAGFPVEQAREATDASVGLISRALDSAKSGRSLGLP